MNKAFLIALQKVFKAEGRYSDDKHDPGNWTSGIVGKGEFKGTKFGISAASYPNLDIVSLDQRGAMRIYKRDYWDKLRLNLVVESSSPRISDILFNLAVNCGPGNAAKFLQRTINTLVINENLKKKIPIQRKSSWQQAVLRLTSNKALKVDGIIGPITINALSKIPYTTAVIVGIFGEAYNYYAKGKLRYRAGWFNRLGNSYFI